MIPEPLMRPTVGLIPTNEFADDGHTIEPSVSVPIAAAHRFAATAAPDPELRTVIADTLCEQGRFGQKTGAGWYDYQAGKRDAIPSELVNKMIDDHRKEIGITPRKISDEEIVQRLVYALVNEGAHILEDGIASKSGDIDMVYLTGYGFPIWRGGPMHYASQVGLYNVAESMKRFAKNPRDDASFWQPAPLIQKLVAEGKSFS